MDKYEYTDTDLLNFIQQKLIQSGYTGMVIMRDSKTGRGIRLHETTHDGTVRDVRKAIINYMEGK